ncbi:fumarylacetoacetate hydrolase family protein, partial [Sedimenticola sp.]|uniref:fumarylacetoacetate hydrolase family protein n=1 Tax=Sedimenticola sp. TaxID=1940285 RepID=UPI003D0EA63F
MRLLTFRTGAGTHWGLSTAEGVLDISAAQEELGGDSRPFEPSCDRLPGLRELLERATGHDDLFFNEDDLELGPCLPVANKIICIGLNYRRHAREANMAEPTAPILFAKYNNCLASAYDSINLPTTRYQYDYESELAVVIGKQVKRVSTEEALDCVFGYCVANDLSERELQMSAGQWTIGKMLDGFLPVGPYLVTADEVGDPQNLGIRCWVNGELRQDSNTSDMIFSVAELISYISCYATLEPGDIIVTGTPEGVILGMENKVWLKPGDEVIVEIDKLGQLRNRLTST